MSAQLAAGVLVAALIRRAEQEGGHAAVIARGDRDAGAILIQLAERGVPGPLLERALDRDGRYRWAATGPDAIEERGEYIARRCRFDPDLWVVELDVAGGAALVEDVAG